MTGRRRSGGSHHGSSGSQHSDSGSHTTPHRQHGDGERPDQHPGRDPRDQVDTGGTQLETNVDSIDTMAGRLDLTRDRLDGVGNTVRGVNVGPESMGVIGTTFTGAAQSHLRIAEEHLGRTTQAVEQAQRGTRGTSSAYRDTDRTQAAGYDAIDTTSTPPEPRQAGTGDHGRADGGGDQPAAPPPSGKGDGGDGGDGGDPPKRTGDDGSWHGEDGTSLTPSQNSAADDFLARAKRAEPEITNSMRQISDGVEGSELVGLDHRLKEEDSFKRKLATAIEDNPDLPVAEHLADMKDSVRYTMQVDEGKYTDGVNKAVRDLQDQGYECVKFKNTWDGDGYQGINSMWRDPKTGHIFEVQFHTESSFDAKMVTHDLYEQARLPGVSPEMKAELDRQQAEIFGRVPRPPGASGIELPKMGGQQ